MLWTTGARSPFPVLHICASLTCLGGATLGWASWGMGVSGSYQPLAHRHVDVDSQQRGAEPLLQYQHLGEKRVGLPMGQERPNSQ